ncbi:hypothetical protein [Streptomyces rhizosphaerihabitans]|uniref:hypothetical protein n=1 Tax=Streptomyces rhizosphaerihabitans TaxID=1266770 RepID=UPI0021C21F58|nr:hypothetical protein [Streptomyces rhizosphaerihabitans]MCT9003734.1 hypothetical protein [Streptomyces rhizosphaerihabitans]
MRGLACLPSQVAVRRNDHGLPRRRPRTFIDWLYRYLIGEEMTGWDSATFYPGPVRLEFPPAGPGQHTREAYGPERGM